MQYSIDGKESLLKVYLANGNSNQIRFNEFTDVDLVISLLTNRLSSDGVDRPLKSFYSIRAFKYPTLAKDSNEDSNEIIWLDNESTINSLIKKYNFNIEKCKFELRIRYFPFTFQEILDKDRVTFYYLYDQIKNDFLQTKKQVDQNTAINLCCLEIRRFFKDISQFALDKKSNYEYLEKEIGLHKFLPSSVISLVKPKVLRKLIQNEFKKVLNLDEIECMIKFLEIVDGIIYYKTENYKCEFKIFIHYLPVRLVIGNEIGISYLTDNLSKPTQMACFQQVELLQTLLVNPDDLKNQSLPDFVHTKKCILQIKVFGAEELLSIICPSVIVVENIAQLIDGYCKLQLKKVDYLWINKYNNLCPRELLKIDNQQPKKYQSLIYDNEEKDYAEIVDEYDDYSVPNCKLNELRRSQIKILNLIGNGNFGQVFRGIYKNDLDEETEVAVKTCKDNENNVEDKFLGEAYIMQQFEHKYIIKLIGISKTPSPVLIIMELAKFGELGQFLQTNKSKINLTRLILYSYQLSEALLYLESKNFVHRDLAARNVLVCEFDIVKLADFGLSRIVCQDSFYYKSSKFKLPIKWMSPESINFRKFTKLSDVWSFAVLVWQILSYGIKPFQGIKNSVVIHKIENGERLPLPEICPPNLYNLLLHCWRYEPKERPNIKQIRNFLHSLLNETGENSLKNESIENDEQKDKDFKEMMPFDDEFKKSLLEIQLKSQERQSLEDAAWLENEEKEMFGSFQLNSSSDNQSLKSENASLSSNNPFIDSLDNPSIDRCDTLQNLNGLNSCSSLSKSSSLELNRQEDKVYEYTMNITIKIKDLLDYVNKGEVDLYKDKIINIGLELHNLLVSVDNLYGSLPEWSHNEISMAHSILSKDFATLKDSMKQAQKYSNTSIEHEFKKKLLKSAHVLVVNSKTLLDTVDSVRLRILNQQCGQVLDE